MQRCDLHNHTRYSNLRLKDALATPEALIDLAIELGLNGVAITDHEALSAHPKANMYAQKIKEANPDFKVILGDEIYLTPARPYDKHYHFILLAKDAIGHYQLRRLSSIAWLNSYSTRGMTRVDTTYEELSMIIGGNPGHLIAATACIGGELGQNILKLDAAEKTGNEEGAAAAHNNIVNFILFNKELFGNDFYLEIQPGVSKDQITVNKRMKSIAAAFGIKIIVTSDTHYLKKEDRGIHKAFLNSEEKEREVDAFYQDTYLHTEEEIYEKLALSNYSQEEINEYFANSMEIYNKIDEYNLLYPQQIPKVTVKNYPKYMGEIEDMLKPYPTLIKMLYSDDQINRFWVNECLNKLKEINKFNETYLAELEEEAEVKEIIGEKLHTNMFSYPVTLAHYINLIWECGSTVGVGRGSACSALNHYLLGITQLDPLEWGFPFFRYMNRDTDGLGDIDIDVCPSKVATILGKIQKERSQHFIDGLTEIEKQSLGANYVCTFGTEGSRSTVLSACRGYRSEEYPDGIDNDTAQYLSALIPAERGNAWTIEEVVKGNPESGRKKVTQFVNEINQYPGLLDAMLGIEGLISRRGRHASGVLFLDSDPYEFNAFMKTPSGEVVTQYDLHDAEACGSTKFDILVTEVQDKITQTLRYLQEAKIIEPYLTIREAYDKYLHPDVLPLNDKKTWQTIQNAAVLDLFQLDSEVGRQGAKKVKPTNMMELSSVNGLIRLMTQEKGEETWLERYVRYKDRAEYFKDIEQYNLSDDDKRVLNKYLGITRGIGISQEQLMRVLMDPDICGFSLSEANKARKVVSKKKIKEIPDFRKQVYNKAKNHNIADCVWKFVVSPGLGYAFSDIHSVSYSFIGFQTAYIATHWNPIFWNTACLVVNSGSLEEIDAEDDDDIVEVIEGEEQLNLKDSKKKKEKQADYAKVAKALGDIIHQGIKVSLVDINKSDYSFEPDIESNEILFGLKALSSINSEIIEQIKGGRPYHSLKDFMRRCPLNKKAMISLIKGGAFDKLELDLAEELGTNSRTLAMVEYFAVASEPKTKLNLQNFNGLLQKGLVPEELDFQKRIFHFNKYLKANCKVDKYFVFDEAGLNFYQQYFDMDLLEVINGATCILQTVWDKKVYSKSMDAARDWLKKNQQEVLDQVNLILFKECWDKYAQGNISAWEMESLCFYYHEHELAKVDKEKYGIVDFQCLPEEPPVDYFFKRNGKNLPIYKIFRIMGTVISKNDTRSTVTLLTTSGVVNVKFTRDQYAKYGKQISEVQPDGTKKIMEKSWFKRGTKLMISGFRRDDMFVAKTYKNTVSHQIYKIEVENDGKSLILMHDRINAIEGEE